MSKETTTVCTAKKGGGQSPVLRSKTTEATAATTTSATQGYFSRRIGNTTFLVSVAFNDKASESIEDKILRLVVSDTQQGVLSKCS